MARTLVAFEYLWYQAWVQSIDTSKAGLQATLIIRHPEDGRLYVNFDQEILQLIREAKCLDRMQIDVPESAKMVLLQQDKFKSYYNDLHYALKEYERVVGRILPVTAGLLEPHFHDMEFKLRPGMVTLTWTSMNIDTFKHHVHSGLMKLEELVTNINDITENRIERHMKIIGKTLLVDLPVQESFTLEAFVSRQQQHIKRNSGELQGKNAQIEQAVEDLLNLITSYPLEKTVEKVSTVEIEKVMNHYNHFMYQALLQCSKNSMNAIKKRVGSRGGGGFLFVERPFFEVDVQLAVPSTRCSPNLDEVQTAINRSAKMVLKCTASLDDWGQRMTEPDKRRTFFDRVTKDIEIVKVVLLLTGSIQGTKNSVTSYLAAFSKYDWLWKDEKNLTYRKFMASNPTLPDYERELMKFVEVENDINRITTLHNIGALSLNTRNLKMSLQHEASQWKVHFSQHLHQDARAKMSELNDYIRTTYNQLNRSVTSGSAEGEGEGDEEGGATAGVELDSLRYVMNVLRELRERESGFEMEIVPVLDM
jgi:dynein heavy chain